MLNDEGVVVLEDTIEHGPISNHWVEDDRWRVKGWEERGGVDRERH